VNVPTNGSCLPAGLDVGCSIYAATFAADGKPVSVTGSLRACSEWPQTEGERWTHAQLVLLSDRGWRPRALMDFLSAAQARANLTRRQRPALARQEARWMLGGAAGWLVLARSLPRSQIAAVRGRGLVWWAGCAVMLDWHLGMLETPEGRAVRLGAADALTLLRAWLVPAIAGRNEPTLLLLGALSDLADGRVARATRCTRLGRDLDGLVDACFFWAALRGAVRAGDLSPGPAAAELVRLLAGATYSSTVYFAAGRAPNPAVRRSGRAAAPVRLAGLVAGSLGRRALGDRLLLTGTLIATALELGELGRSRDACRGNGHARSGMSVDTTVERGRAVEGSRAWAG